MKLDTLFRKVKRQFGDEYGIIINDQDILDWCNESQLDIVRSTSANDVTIPIVANKFPYFISDRVSVKRVAINNKALAFTSVNELDDNDVQLTQTGTPGYWYFESGTVGLWPTPASGDVYSVIVTYAKNPTELNLLAPYLQFTLIPASIQTASTPFVPGLGAGSLNIVAEIAVDNLRSDFTIASSATSSSTPTTFSWQLLCHNPNVLELKISDATTIRSVSFTYPPPAWVAGTHVKFRILYDATVGIATLYTIDLVTGVETLNGTQNFGAIFTANYLSAPITFNGYGGTQYFGSANNWKLYHFEWNSSHVINVPTFVFDGADLTALPDIPTSPFTSTSGHVMTVIGSPSPQVRNVGQLTLPDLYHEDVVRYCIARAHDKNQNYRGADSAMETYNQNVSTRRNEADAIDGPMYKQQDVSDFEGDWWYS